ncbi:MAG TPA: hypothetical protein GYA10_17755 [Alphaproteobacteria bacterium]|nr:hypothetical protein [Alphaproteobacteria bacterium]
MAELERLPGKAPDGLFTVPFREHEGPAGFGDVLAAPGGLVHEIFTDEPRNSGPALGFTLGLAQRLRQPRRPALVYLQLTSDTAETGLPYAPGLAHFGIEPDQIVLGRVDTLTALLWALEEAISCRAVAAVLADVSGSPERLDFTASRRLSLRAAAAGTSAFLLRYGRTREASAARLRWRVLPARSGEQAFDPRAPGPPRFAVTLEKVRLGVRLQQFEGQSFELDWIDHGFVIVERDEATGAVAPDRAAVSRPQLPALGDRLRQAG